MEGKCKEYPKIFAIGYMKGILESVEKMDKTEDSVNSNPE